jgi:hypothetical protein
MLGATATAIDCSEGSVPFDSMQMVDRMYSLSKAKSWH